MTEKEFSSMGITDEDGNIIKDDETISNYLQNIFGTDEEGLQSLLGEDYLTNFKTAVTNYSTALGSFMDGMLETTKKTYENINDTDQLSLSTQKSIASLLEDAIVAGGTEGGNALVDVLNSMNTDDMTDFVSMVSDVDWDTVTLAEFKNLMADSGITIKATDEELESLIEVMSNDLISTFDELAEKYKTVSDIVSGLSDGDTISAENYEKLDEVS
jgi:hypothetical protein